MTIQSSSPTNTSHDSLLNLLQVTAAYDDVRRAIATFDADSNERQWHHLGNDQADVDLWLIFWPADTSTGWHDHGTASGGFTVLRGELTEYSWVDGVRRRSLTADQGRQFGSHHIHDVVNETGLPAISLHGYAPRLSTMTRYLVHSQGIQIIGVDQAGAW